MDVLTRPTADPDGIASVLAQLAAMGRSLPPAWDGARVSTLVAGPQREGIGRMLPGRGLYLDMDLRALGISKPIPHVYERSPVRRWVERMSGYERDPRWRERGTIRGIADIRRQLAGGLGQEIMNAATVTWRAAPLWNPTYRDFGGSYSNIPGGAAHDRSSAGALSGDLTNPISGNKKYLISLGVSSSRLMRAMILADLLVAAANIDCNLNTAQTVNTTALTRYTNGKGVLATFDLTSNSGAGAATLTMNKYTNQDGTSLQTSQAVSMTPGASAPELCPDRTFPIMKLATGDYGIRSVEEVTFSAAMGGGTVALNLFYPLLYMPILGANFYTERDSTLHAEGLSELVQTVGGALGCLIVYVAGDATSTSALHIRLRTVEG